MLPNDGMKRTPRTPEFLAPDGSVIPGSIAESSYLPLGGIDQWVLIRGEKLANPVLITLHGGPGFSDTAMLRGYNADLEKSFTVVYWDQRGTGKSFDRALPAASMTLDQLLADLDELVEHVCERTGHEHVVLLGHSWGSALGAIYAAKHPDKVSAYVGAAQIGDWPAAEAASYAYTLATAEQRGRRRAIAALRRIGPPPYGASAVFAERMWSQRLEGALRPRAVWELLRHLVRVPEVSLLELPQTMRGFRFTMNAMWPEVSRLNLAEVVPALQMPVFFLVGRKDRWVPPEISVAYFDKLAAPAKTLVWFESSGHEAFVDEPAKFHQVMIDMVRPIVVHERQMPRRAS